MTGLQQNRLEAAFGQAGVKPLRQRSGLQPDPLDRRPKSTQKVDDRIRMAFDSSPPDDFASSVDDANTREFQRHINSDIMFHGLSSDPHAWGRL